MWFSDRNIYSRETIVKTKKKPLEIDLFFFIFDEFVMIKWMIFRRSSVVVNQFILFIFYRHYMHYVLRLIYFLYIYFYSRVFYNRPSCVLCVHNMLFWDVKHFSSDSTWKFIVGYNLFTLQIEIHYCFLKCYDKKEVNVPKIIN